MEDRHVYRASKGAAVVFGGIFFATALVLVWIGSILGPDDRTAMDGLTLLLFTVVPIDVFCWVFGAVFIALGAARMRQAFRAAPTLIADGRGLTLPDGTTAQWSDVSDITVAKNGVLSVEVKEDGVLLGDAARGIKLPAWLGGRRKGGRVTLSSFDLNEDPAEVGVLLEKLRTKALSPETPPEASGA